MHKYIERKKPEFLHVDEERLQGELWGVVVQSAVLINVLRGTGSLVARPLGRGGGGGGGGMAWERG